MTSNDKPHASCSISIVEHLPHELLVNVAKYVDTKKDVAFMSGCVDLRRASLETTCSLEWKRPFHKPGFDADVCIRSLPLMRKCPNLNKIIVRKAFAASLSPLSV